MSQARNDMWALMTLRPVFHKDARFRRLGQPVGVGFHPARTRASLGFVLTRLPEAAPQEVVLKEDAALRFEMEVADLLYHVLGEYKAWRLNDR